MKKGISIWSFGGSTPEEAFAAAKQYGFDGVEVELAEEGRISLSSREADLIAVRRSAEAAGISLYSVASGLYWKYSLTSPDPAQREKAEEIVKKQIDAAAVLGCDTVLVVPGAVAVSFAPELGVVPYDAAYARSLEAVRRLAGYAEKKKVCIGLENVWMWRSCPRSSRRSAWKRAESPPRCSAPSTSASGRTICTSMTTTGRAQSSPTSSAA